MPSPPGAWRGQAAPSLRADDQQPRPPRPRPTPLFIAQRLPGATRTAPDSWGRAGRRPDAHTSCSPTRDPKGLSPRRPGPRGGRTLGGSRMPATSSRPQDSGTRTERTRRVPRPQPAPPRGTLWLSNLQGVAFPRAEVTRLRAASSAGILPGGPAWLTGCGIGGTGQGGAGRTPGTGCWVLGESAPLQGTCPAGEAATQRGRMHGGRADHPHGRRPGSRPRARRAVPWGAVHAAPAVHRPRPCDSPPPTAPDHGAGRKQSADPATSVCLPLCPRGPQPVCRGHPAARPPLRARLCRVPDERRLAPSGRE